MIITLAYVILFLIKLNKVNSHVCLLFLDATKVPDRVKYNKLFKYFINNNIFYSVISIIIIFNLHNIVYEIN